MRNGDEPETTSELARNEAIKLTATYLNGLALAFLAIGGLAHTLGVLTRSVPPMGIELIFIVIGLPSAWSYIC